MKLKMVLFLVVLLILPLLARVGSAATDEELAQQYAPIFYFEGEETCFPVDVSYHIENSYLYMVGSDTPVDMDPTLESIASYTTSEYYLDNQAGSVDDSAIISDYQSSSVDDYTVYAHVDSTGGSTVIQYWMFYAFNKGAQNQHEGDWEMVQIVLSGGTPTDVMYSQHHSGQKATWTQVDKDGEHIKVYVSRGSHANYLRSFSGMVGLASDFVGANGKILTSSEYAIVMLENQSWLEYGGLWGWTGSTEEAADRASLLGQAGPPGPMFREDGMMWSNPIGWGDNLLPADDNVFMLELFLYNFVLIVILITILIIGFLVYRIYSCYKKTGLGPRIVSMLYIDGINAKSIGNILCIVGIIVAFFALVNPWYIVSTDIQVTGYETEGAANMMTLDGINGIQLQIPGLTGPISMGSVIIPFSLLLGIGLLFLIIATIGVNKSKKLGRKYILRGVRLFIPFIVIVIVLFALGSIPFESFVPGDANVDISGVMGTISGSPFGGQQTVAIPDISGQIQLQWGFALGGYLLLLSGIILIISGILESVANAEFFTVSKDFSVEKELKKKDEPKKKK
jgi:hypothetical protein